MGKLDGKVALITGAASGIGRASAIRMAAEGAAVMCADIDLAGVRETAAMIAENGSNAVAVLELDVADEAAVQASLQTTVDELGGLDIIFNNAGQFHIQKRQLTRDRGLALQVLANKFGIVAALTARFHQLARLSGYRSPKFQDGEKRRHRK